MNFSELQGYKKVIILKKSVSGRGAARLAHLLGVQGVAGSNPAVPTILKAKIVLSISIIDLYFPEFHRLSELIQKNTFLHSNGISPWI